MKSTILFFGALIFGILCFFNLKYQSPVIEDDIATRTRQAFKNQNMQWAKINSDGRDIVLAGFAPNVDLRKQAEMLANKIWGVRTVDNQLEILSAAPCQAEFNALLNQQRIQFGVASARISQKSYKLLNQLSETANRCAGFKIDIAGYTDSVGHPDINEVLSQQRAQAVANYLVSHGINPNQLTAIGYGELNPIASNKTAYGRAQNRRIEFVVKEN